MWECFRLFGGTKQSVLYVPRFLGYGKNKKQFKKTQKQEEKTMKTFVAKKGYCSPELKVTALSLESFIRTSNEAMTEWNTDWEEYVGSGS